MAQSTTDLGFNVFALDRASKTFEQMSKRVERMAEKMDELDNKRAEPEVNVEVDRSQKKLSRLSGMLTGTLSGAMQIVTAKATIMGAAIVAAIAAAPVAASLAATGIVAALGGGLAAVGIAAVAQTDKVKNAFSDLKEHVTGRLKKMAHPFEHTLTRIADMAKSTFDSFAPVLKRSFEKLAPAITVFADHFFKALKGLKPAIKPITSAFTALLRQIGPMLGPLFKQIGEAVKNLAGVVEDNAHLFAGFIGALVQAIPKAIQITTKMAGFFALVIRKAPVIAAEMIASTRRILQGLQVLTQVALTSFQIILQGADMAFGWVPGVGPKLDRAKQQFVGFRRDVNSQFNQAIAKLGEWETTLRNVPKVMWLRGHIRDLRQKVNAAKAKIKTVPKSKRSEIRARINQLQSKIGVAKNEIASVQDRKVVDFVARISREITDPSPFGLRGPGLDYRAHGGPVRSNRPYIVGERGPELFVPQTSGTVVSNDRLDDMGAGTGGVNVTFAAGSVTVTDPTDVDMLGHRIGREVRAQTL